MTPKELKSRRLAAGLSTEVLAVQLGVKPNTVRRWEEGEIPISVPRALEQILKNVESTGTRRRSLRVSLPVRGR